MITGSEMYWLTRLDWIKNWLYGLSMPFKMGAGLVVIGLLVASVVYAMLRDSESSYDRGTANGAKRIRSVLGWISVPLVVIAFALDTAYVFTPNTKEYAAIKVIPMLATEKVKEDAGELYDLTVEWAKTQLKKEGK